MEYIFYAVNKRYKFASAFSITLLMLNVIGFIYIGYTRSGKGYSYAAIIFLSILFYILLKNKSKSYAVSIAYWLSIMGWVSFEFYWIAASVLVLWLLNSFIKKQFTFNITNAGVEIIASMQNQTHQWSQFNNVILKDGLLTLDYTSNKILQTEVNEAFYVNEAEFNEFCRKQLTVDS